MATLLSSFRLLMIREPHMSGDSGIATTLGDTRLSDREELGAIRHSNQPFGSLYILMLIQARVKIIWIRIQVQ